MIFNFTCKTCGKSVRAVRAKGRAEPQFCSLGCRNAWKRDHRQSPVTKEWLEQKYITEGLDCPTIGDMIDRDETTVWYWLKTFGIPTRARGTTGNFRHVKQHGMLGKTHTPEVREKLRRARKTDGHVPYLKNGVHHLKGKRGKATPNWRGGVTPERQSVYSSPEWKEAVKTVWKRDNATCQRCGIPHKEAKANGITFDIHHIVSFAVRELRCEPTNLILLCKSCHLWIHSSANVNKELLGEAAAPTLFDWAEMMQAQGELA